MFASRFLSPLALGAVLVSAVSANAANIAIQEINRTQNSPLAQNTNLSQDVYRYVERQESYWDEDCYYTTEPYQRQEAYTVPVTRCENVPDPTPTIVVPGGGPGGGHTPTPTPTIVVPGGGPVHGPRRLVDTDTDTGTEKGRRCWTEYETHYRWVTDYHQVRHCTPVLRYRTVTDAIYDHSWGVQVEVIWPNNTALVSGETEKAKVSLGGTEGSPDASVRVNSPAFSYKEASKQRNGNQIKIWLTMVPKYSPEELGEQSIQNLSLVHRSGGGFDLKFEDEGLVTRTNNRYEIELFDIDSSSVVFRSTKDQVFGDRNITIPVDAAIEASHDHRIQIRVQREGVVISGNVDFVKSVEQVGQIDPKNYVDVNGVREFAIEGSGANGRLVFTDISARDSKVETYYYIKISRRVLGFLWHRSIAEANFSREQTKDLGNGKQAIELATFPGLSADEIRKFLSSGDDVKVELFLYRKSPRLAGHSPVQFKKEAKLHVN